MSSVDKVTIGTSGFASVIVKVAAVPAFATAPALSIFSQPDSKQFSIYLKEILTLQPIQDFERLLMYFNDTAIFAFSFFPFASSTATSPIRLDFYLNEELFALHTFALVSISSLLNCHKFPGASE